MSKLFLLTACCPVFVGCMQVGPANPERDAPAYLRSQGYSEATIQGLLNQEELPDEVITKLVGEHHDDVRFLVGQNPHLSKVLHKRLLADKSDYVRGGAALNPNLTDEDAKRISRNGSHATKLYVARNPHVSEAVLIDLHEKYGMELAWFASNPKCPPALIKKMKATNDEDALYWLDVTEQGEE